MIIWALWQSYVLNLFHRVGVRGQCKSGRLGKTWTSVYDSELARNPHHTLNSGQVFKLKANPNRIRVLAQPWSSLHYRNHTAHPSLYPGGCHSWCYALFTSTSRKSLQKLPLLLKHKVIALLLDDLSIFFSNFFAIFSFFATLVEADNRSELQELQGHNNVLLLVNGA